MKKNKVGTICSLKIFNSLILLIATMFALQYCKKSATSNDENGSTVFVADTIAKSNLVAYYSFDENAKDGSGNNYDGTASAGVTYGTGKRGNAAIFKKYKNDYIKVTTPTKLGSLKSVTVSFWVYFDMPTLTDAPPTESDLGKNMRMTLLQLVDDNRTDVWGNLQVYLDGDYKQGDTADLRMRIWNNNAVWKDRALFSNKYFYNGGFAKWNHIVLIYDGTSSSTAMYINGNPIELGLRWKNILTEQWADEPMGQGKDPYGNLNFNKPANLVIGNWAFKTGTPTVGDAWPVSFGGQLDEMRIYDKGLSATQIKAIYLSYLQ